MYSDGKDDSVAKNLFAFVGFSFSYRLPLHTKLDGDKSLYDTLIVHYTGTSRDKDDTYSLQPQEPQR